MSQKTFEEQIAEALNSEPHKTFEELLADDEMWCVKDFRGISAFHPELESQEFIKDALESVLIDVLMVTMWEIENKTKVSFTVETLLRYTTGTFHDWLLGKIMAHGPGFVISDTGEIRIRECYLKEVMDNVGIYYEGYLPEEVFEQMGDDTDLPTEADINNCAKDLAAETATAAKAPEDSLRDFMLRQFNMNEHLGKKKPTMH